MNRGADEQPSWETLFIWDISVKDVNLMSLLYDSWSNISIHWLDFHQYYIFCLCVFVCYRDNRPRKTAGVSPRGLEAAAARSLRDAAIPHGSPQKVWTCKAVIIEVMSVVVLPSILHTLPASLYPGWPSTRRRTSCPARTWASSSAPHWWGPLTWTPWRHSTTSDTRDSWWKLSSPTKTCCSERKGGKSAWRRERSRRCVCPLVNRWEKKWPVDFRHKNEGEACKIHETGILLNNKKRTLTVFCVKKRSIEGSGSLQRRN